MRLQWKWPFVSSLAIPSPGIDFRRRTYIEWAVLTLLVLGTVVLTVRLDWLQRADMAVYDEWIGASHRPASDAIVIVAIDDKSIEAIGRWPWRRTVLAAVVDRIAAGAPRALGLDVILTEPDYRYPADDAAFAESLASAGPTVILPAFSDMTEGAARVRLPMPELHAHAGHINVAVDADGVAREVFLEEGPLGSDTRVRHFALRMAEAFQMRADVHPRFEPTMVTDRAGWQRNGRLRIPFVGPPGSFMRVSVIDVLDGKVSPEWFRGKAVLIGATATGLGDFLSTPVSHNGRAMSGVEFLANTLQALLENNAIVRLGDIMFWLATLLPVLLVALISLKLAPRAALVGTLLVIVVLLAASYLLLHYGCTWWTPSAAISGCVLFVPLWFWLRQEAALRFLAGELRRLDQEPGLIALQEVQRRNSLDDRMQAVVRMSAHVRDVRRFLADGLESLPQATLICRQDGTIMMTNRSCVALAPSLFGEDAGVDLTVPALPGINTRRPTIEAVLHHVFDVAESGIAYWNALCETPHAGRHNAHAGGIEMATHDDRRFLLHGAPLHGEQGGVAGMIVSLIDITQVRLAERQREQTLHFLSHDMRSPQASILALIELQESPQGALAVDELLRRIGAYANRTLALADDFVHLARAESNHRHFAEVDLAEVMFDASDDLWPLAKSRDIQINVDSALEYAPMYGESALLSRAIANLVSNAVKYSAADSSVLVQLSCTSTFYRIDVTDHGPGITQEDQARLFQPFSRLQASEARTPAGSGLGLVFVRTVAERHGGRAEVSSRPGHGSTFTIILPRYPGAVA